MCRLMGIPAEDIRAFKMSELCGHVEHELCATKKQAFFMCWFPFTANLIMACMLLLTGSYRIFYIGGYNSYVSYIFLWLGISCAANCVPSFEDVLTFKDLFYAKDANKLHKVLFAPFFGVIYVCALLERYSLTIVLSIIFAVIFPHLFNLLFPLISNMLELFAK